MRTVSPVVWMTLVFESALLGLAIGLGVLFEQPALARLDFGARDAATAVAATLPLVAAMAYSLVSTWGPLVALRATLRERVAPLFAGCSVLELATISLAAGVGEEVLFRGFLQTALSALMTPAGAVVATSILFGLAHAVSATYVVFATLFSCYLGALLLVSGNLLVPIFAHAGYDFVALVAIQRFLTVATESD